MNGLKCLMSGGLMGALAPTKAWIALVLGAGFMVAAASCQGPIGTGNAGNVPGNDRWDSEDVECAQDSDCADKEVCLTREGSLPNGGKGLCQPKLCTNTPESSPPLGQVDVVNPSRELLVLEGEGISQYTSQQLATTNGATGSAYSSPATSPRAMVGGDFFGTHPESVAVATGQTIHVGTKQLGLSFAPVALAAGDVNADGRDEIVAIGGQAVTKIAICSPSHNECIESDVAAKLQALLPPTDQASGSGSPTMEGFDVTVADVDGDGLAEPVMLLALSKNDTAYPGGPVWTKHVVVWNPVVFAGEKEFIVKSMIAVSNNFVPTLNYESAFFSLSAGDLDDDGVAELAILENTGVVGSIYGDKLHIFRVKQEGILQVAEKTVSMNSQQVLMTDLDNDGRKEISVLDEAVAGATLLSANHLEVYKATASGDPPQDWTVDAVHDPIVLSNHSGTRITMADTTGDAAYGKLLAGPTPIRGRIAPIIVALFPPYPRTYSDGAAQVIIGDTESKTETTSDSVTFRNTLQLWAYLGVKVGIGPASANANNYLSPIWGRILSKSSATTLGTSTTERFFLDARPEQDGPDNAGILIGVGCYDAYAYKLEDPKGASLGRTGDGSTFIVSVPTKSETAVWHLRRYNALAKQLGNLPEIHLSSRVGDPMSYPDKVATLSGSPVPAGDMVVADDRT